MGDYTVSFGPILPIKYNKELIINYLDRRLGRESFIGSMPNYTAAGSYCFFSQCIQLDSLVYSDLHSSIHLEFETTEGYESVLKFAPLLNHEVKHWYDAHSTLWGLKLLSNIYSCRYDLIVAENAGIATPLEHFDKQMKLRDAIEFIKYPEYYTTRNPKANIEQPWSYQFSCGTVFTKYGEPSDRHIFFTRFQNRRDELIARVPFSLCALLEASAVSQELNTKVLTINAIEDPVAKTIETRKLLDNTMAELYNENLVEYSVVAHKVANSFALTDAIEAYSIAAILTRFILNLPDDVIVQIEPRKVLLEQFATFYDAYSSAIKYKDLGAVFSLLVDALYSQFQSKGTSVTIENIDELISNLFDRHIGLTIEKINEISCAAIANLLEKKSFGENTSYVIATLKMGAELHKKFGLFGSRYINLDEELIPDFVLGDGTFVSSIKTTQQSFENRYFEMNSYYDYLRNFANACIV